jgi:DNA-binding CsgD family transcriptional regulator/PAS domain-containing protein
MINVTVEDFSRLVAGIYTAAVTPAHWEPALRDICRALDGTTGGLPTANGAVWSIQDSALPAGAAESYAEYYGQLDRVLDAVEKGPVGAVRTGTELIPLVRKSEFFEGWMRPYQIGEDGLFVRLSAGPRPAAVVVSAPRRTEAFDTPERVKLMSGLVPHLQQALRTQSELTSLAHSSADLAAALEVVRHGVVIVGSDWWLINLNTAAERILRAEDGLQMRSARLAATGTDAEHKLQRALHAALTDHGSKIRSGRSLICERPSGKRPYVVHVLPLHHTATDETSSQAKVLVLIIDPDEEPQPAGAPLRHLYGLTMAEADVALRIARGANLKEISDGLLVSITTIRKHLQHVYDKTDTHRQAELVRLLLTLRP